MDSPDPGNTSVRFGAAFLRPAAERDHYELMRPVVTVRNEGDRTVTETAGEPFGPIATYRRARRGDGVPEVSDFISVSGPPQRMRTSDPRTGEPIELVLVHWPGMDRQNDTGEER